jgi:hypothetical protein
VKNEKGTFFLGILIVFPWLATLFGLCGRGNFWLGWVVRLSFFLGVSIGLGNSCFGLRFQDQCFTFILTLFALGVFLTFEFLVLCENFLVLGARVCDAFLGFL